MITDLVFHANALKSWATLDLAIRSRFASKLEERMHAPDNPKDRLSGPLARCYKIRLIKEGYRLVYQPYPEAGFLFIRSVGRRDESVYSEALRSLSDS